MEAGRRQLTRAQCTSGWSRWRAAAAQGSVSVAPSRATYSGCGRAASAGGLCTRTRTPGDGPAEPSELYGVHEYSPSCDSSTYEKRSSAQPEMNDHFKVKPLRNQRSIMFALVRRILEL